MRYITPQTLMQNRFLDNPQPAWHTAVISFRDRPGSTILVDKLKATPVGYQVIYCTEESPEQPSVYEANINGEPVGVVTGCIWGGPQAAILVEELAHLGVRQIVGFGAAGSITRDLKKGTQIVATAGLTTDGTSRAYTRAAEARVTPHLKSLVRQAGLETGIDVVDVHVATVDALYRETKPLVQQWRDQGAHAINMETSPLYAAAAVCGVESVWLGHISDCLVDHAWESWESLEAMTASGADLLIHLLHAIC